MIAWLLTPLVWVHAVACFWVRLHWAPGERLERLRALK